MKVFFWGTRGSLPYSVRPEKIRKKIVLALEEAIAHGLRPGDDIEAFIDRRLTFDIKASYGCNTSCVELRGGTEVVVCDAGSGLRDFGNFVMAGGGKPPMTFHLFMSHLHWDHIQGFPFFTPAFLPGNRIHVYGCHDRIEDSFIRQQQAPNFPVPLSAMQADIRFHTLEPDRPYAIAGFDVKGIKQAHPNDSYGYSFEKDGYKFVYSTDSEHQEESEHPDYAFIDFIRNADLLVFDAQYRLLDQIHTKKTWGHSSNIIGVELAIRGNVKHLCLFHNEHVYDDHQLEAFLEETREYAEIYGEGESSMRISLAYDGLEVALGANP